MVAEISPDGRFRFVKVRTDAVAAAGLCTAVVLFLYERASVCGSSSYDCCDRGGVLSF